MLGDGRFWQALLNGVVYAAASVVLQVLVGLPVALLLNMRFRGQALVRGAALVPYVIPTVVVVFIWKWMLDENIGIVNHALLTLGTLELASVPIAGLVLTPPASPDLSTGTNARAISRLAGISRIHAVPRADDAEAAARAAEAARVAAEDAGLSLDAADRAASGAKKAYHNHEAEVSASEGRDRAKPQASALGEPG